MTQCRVCVLTVRRHSGRRMSLCQGLHGVRLQRQRLSSTAAGGRWSSRSPRSRHQPRPPAGVAAAIREIPACNSLPFRCQDWSVIEAQRPRPSTRSAAMKPHCSAHCSMMRVGRNIECSSQINIQQLRYACIGATQLTRRCTPAAAVHHIRARGRAAPRRAGVIGWASDTSNTGWHCMCAMKRQ